MPATPVTYLQPWDSQRQGESDCIYIHQQPCMHACMHACMDTCIDAFMDVCMYMWHVYAAMYLFRPSAACCAASHCGGKRGLTHCRSKAARSILGSGVGSWWDEGESEGIRARARVRFGG